MWSQNTEFKICHFVFCNHGMFVYIVNCHRGLTDSRKGAASAPLTVGAHYFWSAGTTMQRSQQGLMQTLLYDIFRSYPECIPEICPDRWSETAEKNSTTTRPWMITELLTALRTVASQSGCDRSSRPAKSTAQCADDRTLTACLSMQGHVLATGTAPLLSHTSSILCNTARGGQSPMLSGLEDIHSAP